MRTLFYGSAWVFYSVQLLGLRGGALLVEIFLKSRIAECVLESDRCDIGY